MTKLYDLYEIKGNEFNYDYTFPVMVGNHNYFNGLRVLLDSCGKIIDDHLEIDDDELYKETVRYFTSNFYVDNLEKMYYNGSKYFHYIYVGDNYHGVIFRDIDLNLEQYKNISVSEYLIKKILE